MKRCMLSIVGILLAEHAWAGTDSQLHGVWKGTIGTLPIRACFNVSGGYDFGAYYYKSQLRIIHLEESEGSANWSEGDTAQSPIWRLDASGGNTLAGTWEGNGKKHPISLERVAVDSDEEKRPCGTDVFMAPRLTPPKITEMPAELNGASYTKFEVDAGKHLDVHIMGFELNGTAPGTVKINKQLAGIIPAEAAGSEYAECMADNLSSIGQDGQYFVETIPTVLTRNWLVARKSYEVTCGGAHPSHDSIDIVYDLQAGTEIDIATWFALAAIPKQGEEQHNPQGLLRSMVLNALTGENVDCKEVIESAESWTMALSNEGVTFTPSMPHAQQACGDSTAIPFATAQKFMTLEGRARLKSFERELPDSDDVQKTPSGQSE